MLNIILNIKLTFIRVFIKTSKLKKVSLILCRNYTKMVENSRWLESYIFKKGIWLILSKIQPYCICIYVATYAGSVSLQGDLMKKASLFAIICIFIGGLYYFYRLHSNPLRNVDLYRVYYGEIDGKILADMGKSEMVIVEASLFDKVDVERLKENKKIKVLGYLSVMEIGNWDNEIIACLNPDDYLTIDGERIRDRTYQNFLGDISRTHYRQTLLNILENRILAKGMDGVFLDTTDWIDKFDDNEAVHKRIAAGYEEFLRDIKSRFPQIIIVQNRGFNIFNKVGYKYIDGFLWEDFNALPRGDNDFEQRVDELKMLTKKHGIKMFSLSYENEARNKEFASQMGWTHLQHDSTHYDVWKFQQ